MRDGGGSGTSGLNAIRDLIDDRHAATLAERAEK
jgi:hypothetical protein